MGQAVDLKGSERTINPSGPYRSFTLLEAFRQMVVYDQDVIFNSDQVRVVPRSVAAEFWKNWERGR